MTKRPVPKIYVTKFFQLATIRQFAEAERVLQRVKQKMHVSEYNKGYYQALYGILLTQKNNDDRYAFLSNLDLKDKKELQKHHREFLRQSEYNMHAEYDKGLFAAWADYMSILIKMELPAAPTPAHVIDRAEEKKIEESRSEIESQTRTETKEKKKEKLQEEKKEETNYLNEMQKLEARQSKLIDFSK